MTLRLHNTLTRQKEDFSPIDPLNVRMYVCGPTVYDFAHIGNARPAIVFDVLFRLLRHLYGADRVTYVRNVTDIDDKINARAKEKRGQRNIPVLDVLKEITEETQRVYLEDVTALGTLAPTHAPRATRYVPQMIAMIGELVANGHAYEAEGHVLFDVSSKADYGKLSRRSLDDMIAGARVEVAPYKKGPMDFVLWKPSDAESPGWDSPWGFGRPGWHIECSAMIEDELGSPIDIHGGGLDLIFPHHENEIAQSVCAHGGEPYVNYWMHNGYLMVEGKKMAKSDGNVVLVHDLIKRMPGEAIRFALLSTHYRQPFDWTEDLLQQCKRTLDRFYGLLRDAKDVAPVDAAVPKNIVDALEDDLNTPKAFAEMAVIARALSTAKNDAEKAEAKGALLAAGKLLGVLQQDAEAWFKTGVDERIIEQKIAEMEDARRRKDYQRSDEIRALLKKDYAVSVSQTPEGIKWRKES